MEKKKKQLKKRKKYVRLIKKGYKEERIRRKPKDRYQKGCIEVKMCFNKIFQP